MSAKTANSLIDTVINQEGIVKAQGLVERNGEIILDVVITARSKSVMRVS